MFDRCASGPMGGDMTCVYSVFLHGEYTVGKFIDEMLQKYGNEWGNIEIRPNNPKARCYCCFSYKDGKVGSLVPEYRDKKIVRVSASGGWSRMDYILWVGNNDQVIRRVYKKC